MVRKVTVFFIIIIVILSTISSFNYKIYATDTVDSVMEGAQDFLNKGKDGLGQIDDGTLQSTSDFIFNLLLAIALVVAVIIGIVIGIQFMTASVEEKAKVKESLMPYVVGCVVVFGAFGIWKLAITILSNW